MSQSNCSGPENCVKVYLTDIFKGCRMLVIEFCYKIQGQNVRDPFPRVMFSTISCKGNNRIKAGGHTRKLGKSSRS